MTILYKDDDDDDDDDDLCEVTGMEQGPHPKVAVHGAVYFTVNDLFPLNFNVHSCY
jgi:hypothetical protein